MKGSEIHIQNVLFNKTRIGFINVLKKMNAKISISNIKTKQNEKTADISVKYSQKLKGIILNKKEVVNMIDEITIFALIACYANGTTKVSDAIELRYNLPIIDKSLIDIASETYDLENLYFDSTKTSVSKLVNNI